MRRAMTIQRHTWSHPGVRAGDQLTSGEGAADDEVNQEALALTRELRGMADER